MSRVFKPVAIPKGVEIKQDAGTVSVKGSKGELSLSLCKEVTLNIEDGSITVALSDETSKNLAIVGTTRSLVSSMFKGVSEGFEKKLELVGVGYRAQAQGKSLNLTLGFSHPVDYPVPEGITIETPSQTEVVVKGTDKQRVGQIAAEIRAYRPPEPYKGKGVRYAGEHIIRKEAKKK